MNEPSQIRPRPAVRYFRAQGRRADGTRFEMGLYRRERDGDVTGDAVLRRDGAWHFTTKLVLAEKGLDDTEFREVDADEAAQVAVELFGHAGLLDGSTVAP